LSERATRRVLIADARPLRRGHLSDCGALAEPNVLLEHVTAPRLLLLLRRLRLLLLLLLLLRRRLLLLH
jgi:hypothetical protein